MVSGFLSHRFQLDSIRTDEPVKKDFQIECQLLQVHPITKEVIIRMGVQSIHLTSFGFSPDKDGYSKFVRTIFHVNKSSAMTYSMRYLSNGEFDSRVYSVIDWIQSTIGLLIEANTTFVYYEPQDDSTECDLIGSY